MKKNSKTPIKRGAKRITSLILTIMMVVGIFIALPFTVEAAETKKDDTGASTKALETGDNISYNYDSNSKTLVISGTGEMPTYDPYNNKSPWYTYRNYIQNIIIENGITSISSDAFKYLNNLTTVSIPDSVTTIGDYAFLSCNKLTTVTFSDNSSLVYIGEESFGDCSKLTNLIIPDSVTSIGAYAFLGCSSLVSLEISNNSSLTTIGENAFSGCYNILNINIQKGDIGIAAFSACSGLLSATIGDGVNIIGDDAFIECTALSTVSIGDNVLSIGNYAFNNCSSLTTIILGENSNLASIGEYAFCDCSSLTNKPNNIPTNCVVAKNAFYGCELDEEVTGECDTGLTWTYHNGTLTISGTGAMASYGAYPWSDYRNKITNVIIENGVTAIGDYFFWGDEDNHLTSITIPNSVEYIGAHAFQYCENLRNITIPNGVKAIGTEAFATTGLTSVRIPSSVENIGKNAFSRNESLTSIIVDSNNSNYDSRNNCNAIIHTPSNSLIVGCNNSTVPNGVISIQQSAFESCYNLTSISIPDSVTFIGEEAFCDCANLTTFTTTENSNLKEIYYEAFQYCYSLVNFHIPKTCMCLSLPDAQKGKRGENITSQYNSSTHTLTFNGTGDMWNLGRTSNGNNFEVHSIVFSEGITSIAPYAFYRHLGLTDITIPSTMTSIGEHAFANYDTGNGIFNIRNIHINNLSAWCEIDCEFSGNPLERGNLYLNDELVTEIDNLSNIDHIGSNIFYNYQKITKVNLPDGVTSIGNSAFSNCTELTSVTIPESVTSIGNYAFADCGSLTSIIIPDGVEIIGNEAFWYCRNLSSIVVGNDVTTIGKGAFASCPVVNIVVPDTVRTIGEYAFYDCNMVICPMDSYTFTLLNSENFTHYRSSTTMVVGIVTAKSQLSYILRKKSSKNTSSNNTKFKISTGASEKYITGEEFEEEILTPEQIAENLSHVQCYVVEDLDVDETLTFDSDLDVTLHLNDFETDSKGNVKVDKNGKIVDGEPHTLTASTRDAMIEVPDNGKLTIEATSESNGGLINTKGAVFDVKDGGSLTIKNGTYSEDVSKYTPDNKVMGKTNGLYTVLNPKTEDMTLDNDGRQVIMPNNQDTFARNDLVGVQMRAAEEREYINEGDGQIHTVNVGEGMRFVSVVRSDILRGAKDYGYVIVKATNKDFIDNNKDKLVANGSGCKTVSLKGTKNTLAKSEYSSANLNEGKYKYLTTAVTGIKNDNDAVGVRFYIKRADGTYVYADYTCCATMGMIKAA